MFAALIIATVLDLSLALPVTRRYPPYSEARKTIVCSEGRDNAWLVDPSGSGADKLRSSRLAETNVRYWHKADIDLDAEHVRFRGQSGHP